MPIHHCYFKDKIVPSSETFIQISDLGLLRGYGLFDYFRTYNSKPFQWDLYWERYVNSAKRMNIPNPISKERALEVVLELIKRTGLDNCAIRFVLTGGYADDSITMSEPNLLIMSEDIHYVAKEDYTKGLKVMTYEFVRDIPEIKSTDYKHLLILQPEIKKAGVQDVLFHKDGEVSELSRSNIFHFKDNVLITPNENILNGITRQTILSLAKPHFKIEARPVTLKEFLAADETFTTSSTKRVMPITHIDQTVIGNGEAGPKTRFLQKLIDEMVASW